MTLRTYIDKAGKYPVIQAPCPYQQGFLVNLDAPPSGILHTTEGGWNGSMDVFKVHYSPHFIVGLNASGQPEIAQLVPIGHGALACKEHNNDARVEIEMVANSKETLWLPDDQTLDALASLMVVCRDEWGIPLSHPWKVGDYGRAGDNPHRHSGKYGSVAGWFGHADMPPSDSHWDPGNLDWDSVFGRAAVLGGSPVVASFAPPVQVTAPVGPSFDTRKLQHALNLIGLQPPLVEDGVSGPKTRDALARFQSANRLFANGTLDIETTAALAAITKGH